MENENVCLFLSEKRNYGDLYIFHYVYETEKKDFFGWQTLPYYRINLVLEGEGVLHTQRGEYALKRGDIFFCLPGVPFLIEWKSEPIYCYIGCLGEIAKEAEVSLGISPSLCVFSGYERLSESFAEARMIKGSFLYNYCRGLFLTAVSLIGSDLSTREEERPERGVADMARKYVEENFADSELTLESMCRALSYNPKYVSGVFKKHYKVSFREYLTAVRINNACALMNKGFVGIKDVSFLSGFSDPLYFSKVFKERMGETPTDFLRSVTEKKN